MDEEVQDSHVGLVDSASSVSGDAELTISSARSDSDVGKEALSNFEPARSKVLANEDLLESVFTFFDPVAFLEDIWSIEASTRNNLYSACLTCRSFYNPALTLLWRMMNSIIPVLKLIPAFSKVTSTALSMTDTYTLSGSIEPEHIARLEMHTKRIRYLHFGKSSAYDTVPGHILFRLAHLQNLSLFPALKEVSFPSLSFDYLRNNESLNFLFLVHGKSLSTVTLGGITSASEAFISSYLSTLSQKCQAMETLTLSGRLTSETLCLLPHFHQLHTLYLTFDAMPAVEVKSLKICSQVNSLKHLSINLNGSTTSGDDSAEERTVNFNMLEDLEIGAPPHEALRILRWIDEAKSLEYISLSSHVWTSDPSFAALSIEACIRECSRFSMSIRQLSVHMARKNPAIVLARQSLMPLVACKDLQCLQLMGMSLAVTDADISDLCARGNWANLRDLWLPPSVDGESPSLASLHNLASHCPKLRSVGIPIDFRLDFDSPKKPRHRPRRKHKLEHLTIFKLSPSGNGRHEESGTTIRTAIAVARFLEYHFPFLRSGLLKGDGPNSEWWTTVHLLIAEYQSIRAEERQEAKFSGD